MEGASGVHLVQAPSKAGCVLQCLVQDPLSLTCLFVFQVKMTVHMTHCCAVNEKCYLMHGLEGGGLRARSLNPSLNLSRTGFGGRQQLTEGRVGWFCKSQQKWDSCKRLGRKFENMSLVVEAPFTQLIDPFPAHFHYCHGFVLFCFCHECLGTWPIQQLFQLQTLLLGISVNTL